MAMLRITAIVGSDRFRIPCSGQLTVKELISLIESRRQHQQRIPAPWSQPEATTANAGRISELRTIDNIRLSDQDLVGNLLGDSDVVVCLTVSPEDGEALPGELVGHYLLQRQIGEGTFGFVFQATDLNLNRQVAVKVLRRSKSNRINTRRFLREAELNGRLSVDPHIVTVYDFGHTASNRLFIVMELLQGCPLDQLLEERIRDGHPFSMLECIRLVQPVLSALRAAHNHRPMIVHRDLKPENLWLTPSYLELFSQLRQDRRLCPLRQQRQNGHHLHQHQQHQSQHQQQPVLAPAVAAADSGAAVGPFLGPQPQPLHHQHERAWLTVLLNNQSRLGRSGEPLVKLMDFGIAIYDEESPGPGLSAEEAGSTCSSSLPLPPVSSRARTKACGTRMYASPEQMQSSSRLDGRSDIWSVGVLMYQLLSLASDLPWDTFELAKARRATLLRRETVAPLGHQRLAALQVPCLREFGPRSLGLVLREAHRRAAAEAALASPPSLPPSSPLSLPASSSVSPAVDTSTPNVPLPFPAVSVPFAPAMAPISEGMGAIVHRCLELDPELRWHRAEDLAAALHAEEMALIRELYPYPFPIFGFDHPAALPLSSSAPSPASSAASSPPPPPPSASPSASQLPAPLQHQLLEAAVPVPASAAESAVLADALTASLQHRLLQTSPASAASDPDRPLLRRPPPTSPPASLRSFL